MRRALGTEKSGEALEGENLARWAALTGLCCQAAGGNLTWAEDLTLAWLLFYAAAGIIDSVQDQDDPNAWWIEAGPEIALSAATGIYFSASEAISRLQNHNTEQARLAAGEIIQDYYRTLLVMSSGQYTELVTLEPTLDQYWKFVEAKSGAFFSLACRNGARLATHEQPVIQAFSNYGMHLGLLIQILDDLDDIRMLQGPLAEDMIRKVRRGLPFIYALEVVDSAQKETLRECIRPEKDTSNSIEAIVQIMDQCGAALYVLAEIEKQRGLASEALKRAHAPADQIIKLAALVHDL